MPVILRVNGYKFFFYQADMVNEPPHVHIMKDGNEAKFWLDPSESPTRADFGKTTYATLSESLKIIWCFF